MFNLQYKSNKKCAVIVHGFLPPVLEQDASDYEQQAQRVWYNIPAHQL